MRDLFAKCTSYSNIIRECNLDVRVSYIKTLQAIAKQYSIDTSHFMGHSTSVGRAPILKNEEIFRIGYLSTKVVKSRILKDRLIPYICADCSNEGLHNGKPLTLQLDHVNGNNTDNRLENLRFLCPNCHSQTDNFTGKNIQQKMNYCVDCGVSIKKKRIRCDECIVNFNASVA